MSEDRTNCSVVVADLIEAIDRIEEWDEDTSDFVEDVENKLHRPDFEPSTKQLAWLARLHVRFVSSEGIGEDLLYRLRKEGRL